MVERKITLPLGMTETTAGEIRRRTDPEIAFKVLKETGFGGPEQEVYDFISRVPDLLGWLGKDGRVFPWRETTDPWGVYIAEILLKRTRASAVEKIYEGFIRKFPNPRALRGGSKKEIKGLIEELGLVNRRAKTLRDVAKKFSIDNKVPSSLEELKKPWGVGEYCARACQIFARGKKLGLIDSNIGRVIGRVFEPQMPAQPHKSEKMYLMIDSLVPDETNLARAFNLSLIDLGAKVCTPKIRKCKKCPLKDICAGY